MAEEIEDAALNVPRAIFTTMILNGALGFGMLLALLFCLGDINDALKTPTGYPFIEIFVQGTGSISGSTAMAAIAAGLGICAVVGFVASASRMTWSFARDKALPFSRYITKLDRRTSIPFVAIAIVATIPCLLVLINIGSLTVFNDVISLSVSGFYISYFLPSALLLWRRTTGAIALPSSDLHTSSDLQLFADSPPLVWGPWRVPGVCRASWGS
ncbi:hypothetical protein MMC14_009850 [Varicellaria rhodocarpa]|nr:hypothetical protein [Varicellaria rhodocarpa]